MMDKQKIQEFIAKRVALELRDGDLVNTGIGLPTLVANFVPEDRNIHFQSKMALSVWDLPHTSAIGHIVNAGGMPVTINPVAAF